MKHLKKNQYFFYSLKMSYVEEDQVNANQQKLFHPNRKVKHSIYLFAEKSVEAIVKLLWFLLFGLVKQT